MGQKRVQDQQIEFLNIPGSEGLNLTSSAAIVLTTTGPGADIDLNAADGVDIISLGDPITLRAVNDKIQFLVASQQAGWQIIGVSSAAIPKGTLLPIFGSGVTQTQIGASNGAVTKIFVGELHSDSGGMEINASGDITVSATDLATLFASSVTIEVATSSGLMRLLSDTIRLGGAAGGLLLEVVGSQLDLRSESSMQLSASSNVSLIGSQIFIRPRSTTGSSDTAASTHPFKLTINACNNGLIDASTTGWTIPVSGHMIPIVGSAQDIGSSARPIRDLYLSGSSVSLDGDQVLFKSGGNVELGGTSAISISATDLRITAVNQTSITASRVNISAIGAMNLNCGGIFTASAVGNIALRSSGTFFASANANIDLAALVDLQLRAAGTITASAVGNIAIRSSGTFFVSATDNVDLKASNILLAASGLISLAALDNNVIGVPADFTGFNIGAVVADTLYSIIPITRAMTIPIQSGLTAYARVAPGSVVTLAVNHSGGASVFTTASLIGTVSWGVAQLAGSVNFAGSVALALGGFIAIQSSAVSASGLTLEDFSWTIKARTS